MVLLALLAVVLMGLSMAPFVLVVVARFFHPWTIDAEKAYLLRHSPKDYWGLVESDTEWVDGDGSRPKGVSPIL